MGTGVQNEELLDVGSESREDETSDASCCSGDRYDDINDQENEGNDIDDGTRNSISKQT